MNRPWTNVGLIKLGLHRRTVIYDSTYMRVLKKLNSRIFYLESKKYKLQRLAGGLRWSDLFLEMFWV